ncbi:hypothetical protein N836_09310 [Leptolyngbya sp. Heron Island J]|uniref:DUF928 domain-containing protein n=1 Tax=Leptolyngbya sp. Heron Island J TaxID=1385935 RepID=UPI0003B977E8|nr:DUF928 domain-containing protein [Leptolyngbya sp. Heron Island J]ESA36009.1 hypothetical protein N836_09310 [Leptolyngbya sp. Heron Island J]
MLSIPLKLGTVVTAIGFLSLLGGTVEAFSYQTAPSQLLALDPQSFEFIPPEDDGQPRTNRASGRRDQLCNNSASGLALTLLIPPSNQGITTAAHPIFLAYLPQTSAQQAFLTLEGENNDYLYHTLVDLPETAGIVSFAIPETAPVLEPDQHYKFSLGMIYGQTLDPNDPVIEGWIQRITPDTVAESQPSQEASFELGAWYARNGIWFDALALLADLRATEPDNLDAIAAWEELLQSVGLDRVGTAPLLNPVD